MKPIARPLTVTLLVAAGVGRGGVVREYLLRFLRWQEQRRIARGCVYCGSKPVCPGCGRCGSFDCNAGCIECVDGSFGAMWVPGRYGKTRRTEVLR